MHFSKLAIFVSRRLDVDSYIVENPYYIPVECGSIFKADTPRASIQQDSKGDNISSKRSSFCEFTVQYWGWKNFDFDFYGLCHYRRYLALKKKNFKKNCQNVVVEPFLDEETVKKYGLDDPKLIEYLTARYPIIVNEEANVTQIPTPSGFQNTVYEHWAAHHKVFLEQESLDLLVEYIKELKPEYLSSATKYLKGSHHRGYNCFLMRKDLFKEMCGFQFSLLFALEADPWIIQTSKEFPRTLGYLGEILYGIFIFHCKNTKKLPIKELPLIYFEYTSGLPKNTVKRVAIKTLIELKVKGEKLGFFLFPKNSWSRNFLKSIYYYCLKSFGLVR